MAQTIEDVCDGNINDTEMCLLITDDKLYNEKYPKIIAKEQDFISTRK